MKRVYSFQHDSDNYLSLLAKRDKDQDIMLAINGGERPNPWVPPQVMVDASSRKLPRGDFLNFNSIPQIVTSRCRQLLLPLVREHVDFLPLPFGTEALFVM